MEPRRPTAGAPDVAIKTLSMLSVALLLSACEPGSTAGGTDAAGHGVPASDLAAPTGKPIYPPVAPRAPGTPGALPDDRSPVSEAPFTPTSAQGAADVVQTYFALVESGRYAQARALWSDGGRASGMDEAAFATSFADYESYHALVGAPGAIEGAAGSLYVTVPVQVYGRRKDGREVHALGEAILRRVNNVPGSSAEQRLWRIAKLNLSPA